MKKLLALLIVLALAGNAAAQWTQFGGDQTHRHTLDDTASLTPGQVIWGPVSLSLSGELSEPIALQSKVFISSGSSQPGATVALDLFDGSTVWENSDYGHKSGMVANSTNLFISTGTTIATIAMGDGALGWNRDVPSPIIVNHPAILPDGTIIANTQAGAQTGEIIGIASADGFISWRVDVGADPARSPTVTVGTSHYIGGDDGGVRFDVNGPQINFTSQHGAPRDLTVSSNGNIFLTDGNGGLEAYQVKTGTPETIELLWERFVSQNGHGYPVAHGGRVFATGYEGCWITDGANVCSEDAATRLVAYNEVSGALLWTATTKPYSAVPVTPVVANTGVYWADAAGKCVYSLNGSDGKVQWARKLHASGGTVIGMTAGQGVLVVATNVGGVNQMTAIGTGSTGTVDPDCSITVSSQITVPEPPADQSTDDETGGGQEVGSSSNQTYGNTDDGPSGYLIPARLTPRQTEFTTPVGSTVTFTILCRGDVQGTIFGQFQLRNGSTPTRNSGGIKVNENREASFDITFTREGPFSVVSSCFEDEKRADHFTRWTINVGEEPEEFVIEQRAQRTNQTAQAAPPAEDEANEPDEPPRDDQPNNDDGTDNPGQENSKDANATPLLLSLTALAVAAIASRRRTQK